MERKRMVEIWRGPLLEAVQNGCIAVVGETGLVKSMGDISYVSYYRSSSKPIQVLPLLVHGIDRKYGLTGEEISIMSGSLGCSPRQVELAKSIMRKAEISEDLLIMLPCYPIREAHIHQYLREGRAPSKYFHNCIGKHLALILMQRELGGDERDYWKIESPVQQEILRYIALLSDVPSEDIAIGWDGCGVPVFGIPKVNMALSYLRLAATDLIGDAAIASAADRNAGLIAEYPENLMDDTSLCAVLCRDPNIIGKIGADGVYTFGLKKERLGVALKVYDGSSAHMHVILAEILRQLAYENEETIRRLDESFPSEIKDATGRVVGRKQPALRL